uniref:Large ribosomal subunit protein uL6c n=1 Tax=Aureoumbra lagunensis TaxID=44058 RepID=C6KIV5_9STRA|nr:50S ribosomal protein L6 [Aureoumbra lagunensis]ACS36911.1 50S ribosomal protein L6 [Aureoumbra lagunensis]
MSRIGKLPIKIPKNVACEITNGIITVKGPFGTLERSIPNELTIDHQDNSLCISVNDDSKQTRALHGLFRTLVNNMVVGVHERFEINLELKGVGYRCQTSKNQVTLSLGFSHPINLDIPSDIEVQVDANTNIKILGPDKEIVGFFASQIRNFRPPEPYNGKGVLYKDEVILRKAGKAGKK